MKNIDVVRQLIDIVQELAPQTGGRDPEDIITFVKDRPGHDWRYAIDCSKIERELGWMPGETFASGLRETVQWYLDNEAWIGAIEDGSYQGQRLGVV